MAVDTRCRFLELPPELRLLIYGFAVLNARIISIGTTKWVGSASEIIYRQYGDNRIPFRGIPRHCEPVVETSFDANILSGKATIELTPTTADASELISSGTSYQSLLRVNRQVYGELKSHVALPAHRQTNLFVNYPYGLHILQTRTPELLRQSRSVRVCGSFSSQGHPLPRHASKPEALEELEGDVIPDTSRQLAQLVKYMFGPNARHPIEKLELRIYYPGDSYSAIWGDNDSPIVVALRNIALGKVDMVVCRGRHGNGVHLTATPAKKCEREISTVWRKLNEGGLHEPEAGSFIIDPRWPSLDVESTSLMSL